VHTWRKELCFALPTVRPGDQFHTGRPPVQFNMGINKQIGIPFKIENPGKSGPLLHGVDNIQSRCWRTISHFFQSALLRLADLVDPTPPGGNSRCYATLGPRQSRKGDLEKDGVDVQCPLGNHHHEYALHWQCTTALAHVTSHGRPA
jgi:hypothetical protein